MFTRKGAFSSAGRAAVLATVAAVALTAIAPSMALAAGAPHGKGASGGAVRARQATWAGSHLAVVLAVPAAQVESPMTGWHVQGARIEVPAPPGRASTARTAVKD